MTCPGEPWQARDMAWEEELFALFDDLEQQAEAMFAADREAELADRSRAEYAAVTLASRLMASLDSEVAMDVIGVGSVSGQLRRVSDGWCLVEGPGRDWIVRWAAIGAVAGASDRSVAEVAWPAVSRLSVASALRRLADAGDPCVFHCLDERAHEGVVRRVGHDFAEVAEAGGRLVLLPFAQLAAVASRR